MAPYAKRNFVGATAAFAEALRNANSKTRQQHFVFTAPVEPQKGQDRKLQATEGGPGLQYDIDYFAALYGLANRNIQQVSLRVAKLMLPVPAASKQVHDDLILGFDIGCFWSQILRVVLRQDLDVIFKSL